MDPVGELTRLGTLTFFYMTLNMKFHPQLDGRTTLTMTDPANNAYNVSIPHETLCGPSEGAYGKFLEDMEESNAKR